MQTAFVRVSCAILLVLIFATFKVHAQESNGSPKGKATLTGILLVSDDHCDERREQHSLTENRLPGICPEGVSQWGLLAGNHVYALSGDTAELRKYERTRVSVRGLINGKNILVYSITSAQITDTEIRMLIEQLKNQHWGGPQNIMSPTHWMFNFTAPMSQLLEAGPPAQDILLEHLNDDEIKNQIIILLGGIGDEKVIDPIIKAMADAGDHSDGVHKINLEANLALTNLTQREVIWHHGGGLSFDKCPNDPKSCWYAWWTKNRDTFTVSGEIGNRRYSNYPNYGIYTQP